MAGSVTDISAGLLARLESSLPLETKTRMAVNMFTSAVYLPQKETLVLDWLLGSLDVKYKDRLESSHTDSDLVLWEALFTCLEHYTDSPPDLPYTFNTAPDILLNILPCADLSVTPIMSCISHILSLSSSSCPDHPSWSSLISELLSKCVCMPSIPSLLLSSIHTTLGSVSIDPTQDNTPLVIHLSTLHTLHPHPSLQGIVSNLLFKDAQPYMSLFSHLSGSESKYHPTRATSLLLSTITKVSSPHLIMASCPNTPAWLRPSIFSLLLSTQGCPGLVDKSTVEGAKLTKNIKFPTVDRLPGLFRLALPLDLTMEVAPSVTAVKIVQEVVKELVKLEGSVEEICEIIVIVHKHHPQVLEPVLANILAKTLSSPANVPVFPCVLDVMVKLRQVPKLFSKLFLYLRSTDPGPKLTWSASDLELLGATLASLPRVQYLEMWKSLNYHFSSDILSAPSQAKAEQVCSVLSPILSTLLLHSQLADHNLPSTLVPRIQDLMDTTATNLQAVLCKENSSRIFRRMVLDVGSSLADLSKLFQNYRGMQESAAVTELTSALVDKVQEEDWVESESKKRLLVPWYLVNKEKNIERPDCALSALLVSPSSIKQIPDNILLYSVEDITSLPSPVLEHSVLCGVVIYKVLVKLNREEKLFIPEFSHWRCEGLDRLDSYLGKSLGSCLTTFFHSEMLSTKMEQKDLDALGKLPLEYLPSSLKLGATLACLAQVFRKGGGTVQEFGLVGRCLESTEIFRFIDAGKFLNDMLGLQNVPLVVINVVTKSITRFTKPIRDVEGGFTLEESGQDKNNLHLTVCVSLLGSLSKTVCEGGEGTDKKEASNTLANKISKHIVKIFKKKNLDNSEQIDILCAAASEMIKMYSKSGLGKMSKMVYRMVELALSESCKSMNRLLGEICRNLDNLEKDLLPEDWKVQGWKAMTSSYDEDCEGLTKALLKVSSPDELLEMLEHALEKQASNLHFWKVLVCCEVPEVCVKVKNNCIERCVAGMCKAVHGEEGSTVLEGLAEFLSSIFSSSPPCVSTQTEVLCLGTLLVLPHDSAPAALSALASFLSHRATLSTRTITITTLIIRNFLSNTASTATLHALQKVLGLFSRHKADYSSVLPHLVADLVTTLASSPPPSRAILSTSIYPLLDMLDNHSFQYLSSNLSPATNEIFKHLLTSYNSSHKFKGKV